MTGGCDTGRVNVSGVRRASPVTLPVAHSKRVGTRSVAKLRVTVCHKGRQSPDLPPSLPKAGESALLRAPRGDTLPGREAEDSHHRTKPRWQNCSDAQPSLQRSRALQAVRWDHPGGWGGEGGGGVQDGDACTPVADSCQCTAKPLKYCKVTSLQLNKLIKKRNYLKDKIIKQVTEPPNMGTHGGTRAM